LQIMTDLGPLDWSDPEDQDRRQKMAGCSHRAWCSSLWRLERAGKICEVDPGNGRYYWAAVDPAVPLLKQKYPGPPAPW
jgi:hypothetical protein